MACIAPFYLSVFTKKRHWLFTKYVCFAGPTLNADRKRAGKIALIATVLQVGMHDHTK